MSHLETIAVLLGLLNIVLIIRRSLWNFPVGIMMVTLYCFIFAQTQLYSDAGLQVFFLIVQSYGWWAWLQNKAEEGEVIVERLPPRTFALWIGGAFLATVIWGTIMYALTDASYPYWDATIAMFSVAAQIMMTRRYAENWWMWIAVNGISIPLYVLKDLNQTAALYGVFLILAIVGLIDWRRRSSGET